MEADGLQPVSTCRACLKIHDPDDNVDDIQMAAFFNTTYKQTLLISNMFTSCTNLEAIPNDGMPDAICTSCLAQLIDAYEFQMQCIKANEHIRNFQGQTIPPSPPPLQSANDDKRLLNLVTDDDDDDDVITDSAVDLLDDKKPAANCVNAKRDDDKIAEDAGESPRQEWIAIKDEPTFSTVHEKPALPVHESQKVANDDADDNDNPDEEVDDGEEEGEARIQHVCDYCPKIFMRQKLLIRHVKLHSQYQPPTCRICDRSFVLRRQLNEHMNRHAVSKPYKCHVCNKGMFLY